MIDQTFGEWVVLEPAKDRVYKSSPQSFKYWLCRCTCGREREVLERNLKNGLSLSCGHNRTQQLAAYNKTHGHTVGYKTSSEYRSYHAMMQRCLNPNHDSYWKYGAKGITVCERWQESFENFLSDMGLKSKPNLTIDRIDGELGYFPTNCRWATYRQQNNNLKTNVILDYQGKSMTIHEWSDYLGVNYQAMRSRYRKGASVEEILGKPYRSYKPRK